MRISIDSQLLLSAGSQTNGAKLKPECLTVLQQLAKLVPEPLQVYAVAVRAGSITLLHSYQGSNGHQADFEVYLIPVVNCDLVDLQLFMLSCQDHITSLDQLHKLASQHSS